MDRLVDHLFVFEGNGIVKDYPGNYSQFRESEKAAESEVITKSPIQKPVEAPLNRKKLSFNDQREFERLQNEINILEKERNEINQQLVLSGLPFEQVQKLTERIVEIGRMIDEKELRWLELSESF